MRATPAPERAPSTSDEPTKGAARRYGAFVATMVRAEGFEPPRLASLEPKSSASTNSATPAHAPPAPRSPVSRLYITVETPCIKKVARCATRAERNDAIASGIRKQIVDDRHDESEADRERGEGDWRFVLNQHGGNDRDAASTQEKMKHGRILLYFVPV